MERKILNLQLVLIFVLAIGFALAQQYHGTVSITSSDNYTSFGPTACQENWSSSFWTMCSGGTQTFACYDSNQCGTTDLKPALCGTVRNCTITSNSSSSSGGGSSSSGGGGSSGGGSSYLNLGTTNSNTNIENLSSGVSRACVENWQCGNWSDQKDSCGTRTCTDLNNCGTTELKPVTTLSCSASSITGGVIGALTSGAGITIILILLALGIGTIILFAGKKDQKKPSAE